MLGARGEELNDHRVQLTQEILVDATGLDKPRISPTPRDETDTEQHDSLKTNDTRDEIDTQQPFDTSF
jgi:hypothetical protein